MTKGDYPSNKRLVLHSENNVIHHFIRLKKAKLHDHLNRHRKNI